MSFLTDTFCAAHSFKADFKPYKKRRPNNDNYFEEFTPEEARIIEECRLVQVERSVSFESEVSDDEEEDTAAVEGMVADKLEDIRRLLLFPSFHLSDFV